jgi:hypothetical protein
MDVKDDAEALDFGMFLGAGLDTTLANNMLLVFDVRYEIGLTDLDSANDIKNRVLSLNSAILF